MELSDDKSLRPVVLRPNFSVSLPLSFKLSFLTGLKSQLHLGLNDYAIVKLSH